MANINRRPIRRRVSHAKFIRIGRHSHTNTAIIPIDYEAATKAKIPYSFRTGVIVSVLDEIAYYMNVETKECWAWRVLIQEHLQGKPYVLMPTNRSRWCTSQWDWEAIYLEALVTGRKYVDTEAYQIPLQYKHCKERWIERLTVLKSHFKHQLEQLI